MVDWSKTYQICFFQCVCVVNCDDELSSSMRRGKHVEPLTKIFASSKMLPSKADHFLFWSLYSVCAMLCHSLTLMWYRDMCLEAGTLHKSTYVRVLLQDVCLHNHVMRSGRPPCQMPWCVHDIHQKRHWQGWIPERLIRGRVLSFHIILKYGEVCLDSFVLVQVWYETVAIWSIHMCIEKQRLGRALMMQMQTTEIPAVTQGCWQEWYLVSPLKEVTWSIFANQFESLW